MPNIIMKPLVLEATADKPARLQVWFSLNETLAGSRVRLIVYDEQLYAAAPLGQRFENGKEMRKLRELDLARPILAADEIDPKLGAGSGVLLKLEGRVKLAQGKWFFEVQDVGHEENVSGLHGSIELRMVAQPEHAPQQQMSKVALISYLKDDVGRASGKYVVRMVLIQKAITATNFTPSEQLLSSLNPKHNPAQGARHQVKLASLEVKKSAKLPSDGRPAPQKASATSRLVAPDLTGLWEAEPAPQEHPVLHVQMNQAGHAVVGWYHRIGFGGGFPVKAPPAPAGTPQFDGVFKVFMHGGAMPDEGWPLTWSEYGANKDADPDALIDLPQANNGRLRVLPGQDDATLDLEAELVLEGPAGKATVKLIRYDRNARWSNAAIAALPSEAAREEMVAVHRKPIPSTYWQRLNDFCSNTNTKLVDAISKWEGETAGSSARRGHGETVAGILGGELGVAARYRNKVLTRFRAYAMNNKIKSAKGTEKPLQDWIDEIVAEEFDHHRKAGLSDKDIYDKHLSPGFRTAGVSVPGNFFYTGTFDAPIGVSGKVIIGGGVSAFFVKFKKEELKGGKRVEPPTTAWDPTLEYTGLIYEVGAGLMIGGGTPSPGGASAQPGTVEFKSAFDLDQNDFVDADFSVVALTGPSVSVGGFSFTTAKTSGITLSLKNGVRLSAVVDKVLKLGTPTSIKKPKLSLEFNIVNVSGAYGHIVLSPKSASVKPKKADIPKFHKEHRTSWLARREVQYERDGSTLTGVSRRDLEASLAVERVWFTIGDGFFFCVAYASPEGTRDFNNLLTGLRAENVLQGVKDAFGPALKLSDQQAFGMGEEPSYVELLDPPGPDQKDGKKKLSDFTKAEQERLNAEQANLYSKWRKTELSIQGSPLVVLTAPLMKP